MADTRVGLLTGGGDCPGLNAAIRAVVRSCALDGVEVVGFRHGWAGVLDDVAGVLDVEATRGVLASGGTLLGTSRTHPYKVCDDPAEVVSARMAEHHLDALVVIGGEGTLAAAAALAADGVPLVGIPKTIDNDVAGTATTIGFATAVDIATDAVDRLHSTAESHQRVMVVEVMGRHAGWIATYAGMGGGADAILVPERPFDLDEVAAQLQRRHARGRDFSIVVVAEGAVPAAGTLDLPDVPLDEFGRPRLAGGVGPLVSAELERRTGFESRVTVLGHVQRGGSPSAADRVLATRFGVAAARWALEGRFGVMTALQAGVVVPVSLDEATAGLKLVPDDLLETAGVFFG